VSPTSWQPASGDETTAWFGTSSLGRIAAFRTNGDLVTDSPWPLVLWGSDGDHGLLAFATVDPDRPVNDGEVLAADGYALLTGDQLAGLVDFLAKHQAEVKAGSDGFSQLDESDLSRLGLADEVYADHRQRFYQHEGPGNRVVLITTMIQPLPADVVDVRIVRPAGSTQSGLLLLLLDGAGMTRLQEIFRQDLEDLRT
jgi:hypothetical protein